MKYQETIFNQQQIEIELCMSLLKAVFGGIKAAAELAFEFQPWTMYVRYGLLLNQFLASPFALCVCVCMQLLET
uniref:RUN domain-containing protein n=1 Tax=Syphacia muris TaxID=451379 RepID=A0A0N5ABR4_9BILA